MSGPVDVLAVLRAARDSVPAEQLLDYCAAVAAVSRLIEAAEIEALRAEVERLNRLLGRIVEGDGDSTVTIRAGTDAFAAAREYLAAPKPQAVEIEALQAEIEQLRAEVEDYRTNGAAAVRFAPSSAYWSNELRRLFGDDARTGIEVLENRHRQALARAERLAEALRDARRALAFAAQHLPECKDPYERANAALAQEDRNG